MIVYFSGTGNSRFAAEFLAKQLNDELLNAGQRMKAGEKDTLHSDRPWVFVAPIYAWRMANVLSEYIRSAQLTGSKDAYFVLTCGGEIGNAGQYAAQLCGEIGLNYKGILQVVMPENYIALFQTPEEPEARQIVKAALPALDAGAEWIRADQDFPPRQAGTLDRLKSGPVTALFYRFFVHDGPFRSTDACVGCGICKSACPGKAISMDGPGGKARIDPRACIHCYCCHELCPQKAVALRQNWLGRYLK